MVASDDPTWIPRAPGLYPVCVRLVVTDESVEVHLAWWEKTFGLMRDIRVSRDDVSEATVVEDPMKEVMRLSMKVGLRVPWLLYVARTIRLDQAFFVRRGVPALSFSVSNGSPLRRVLVCTPDAEELSQRLSAR
jgi:hypothetical protein